MHKCKKNTFFSSCSRLIVAFACITKQCLHILLTPIRPPQSNLIHSCTYRHIEKKKKKKPTQSPTHRISDKRAPSTSPIQPSYWMFGFQYDTSVCVCVSVCCLLFIPVFNVVWLCSWGAELISFLMVGYQCLSQMNYAFLPYVISSQPGNTGTIW